MAIKRPTTKAAPEPELTDEQPQRKASKPKGDSFSALFDKTKPGGGFMAVGNHRVIIVGFEIEGSEEEGKMSAKVTYEGAANEEEGVAGKSLSQWYQLMKNGDVGAGIGFLKRDLDILGYTDVSFADLEGVFDEIVNEKKEVIINVKQNGQYTNAYLQGVSEG
jgi:hypothetical protein